MVVAQLLAHELVHPLRVLVVAAAIDTGDYEGHGCGCCGSCVFCKAESVWVRVRVVMFECGRIERTECRLSVGYIRYMGAYSKVRR